MNSASIRIEPLNAGIRQAYARLLPEQLEFGEQFLDWKFDWTSPHRGRFAVARDQFDRVIGLSGYISAQFRLGGDTSGIGLQAIDSVVAPEARGKGLFTRLAQAMSEFAQREADLVWGFPNANAAPAWFGKLGWARHGFAPFLVKPLRAAYALRRFGLPFDMSLSLLADNGASPIHSVSDSAIEVWQRFAHGRVNCAVDRSPNYLNWRLFRAPHRTYRVVFDEGNEGGLIASALVKKHGGYIAYLMEVLGGRRTRDLLASELGKLKADGAEVALAWSFPWSPNYRVLRQLGFMPLPPRFRPVEIHFGGSAYTEKATASREPESWYLSYLDSDTI